MRATVSPEAVVSLTQANTLLAEGGIAGYLDVAI
jgi:hypothetical protein